MNGIVYMEIAKYVQAQLGERGWEEVVGLAGVPKRTYYRVADYPDEEALALLAALSLKLQLPVAAVLEDLGRFIVPDLLRMSRFWIKPEWKTLDMILNTERTIHETLRQEGSSTNPPRLDCRRSGADEVTITYASPRRMCSLARGIVHGLAVHFGEEVTIAEPACMLKGAPACELVVRTS